MPTAATTATNTLRGVIEEDGASQPSNQDQSLSGPTDGVHLTCSSLVAITPWRSSSSRSTMPAGILVVIVATEPT
jgi:hypothetical protein